MERISKIERDEFYHDERLFEIQLLRKRIEKLRYTLCGPQQEVARRDEEVSEPRQNVERAQEQNELKAKLLGKMKSC